MKEKKVLNKLTKIVSNQPRPCKKNNDECYTSMQDIINELAYWGSLGKFKDKNIICPCDWDILEGEEVYSITIKYNDTNIETTCNSVFKIENQYDLWRENNQEITINLKESEIEEFLYNKLTCNFIKTLTTNARKWGIKSITASGYNPKIDRGIKFQNVDYSKYDICITNPPFSIMGEFVKSLLGDDYSQKKCDFIFISPFLNRANPIIGLPLMLNKLYLGFGRQIHSVFDNFIDGSNSVKKTVACDWIVSYPEAQNEVNKLANPPELHYEDYKEDFLVYQNMTMKDGTHPIRVAGNLFPTDYNGWMCGPITFLDRMDTSKYEWYGTDFLKFFNTTHPELSPFDHKANNKMMILNGKQSFSCIVFRKKQNNYGK